MPTKLDHYINLAKATAAFSKDPRRQVGAIIVGKAGEIRSTGYNGQPRGCNDNDPARQAGPLKFHYFAHAEENAIANAARVGTPLEGSSILVTKAPCSACMRMIINAGIKHVYAPVATSDSDWYQSCQIAMQMAAEAGVEFVEIDA